MTFLSKTFLLSLTSLYRSIFCWFIFFSVMDFIKTAWTISAKNRPQFILFSLFHRLVFLFLYFSSYVSFGLPWLSLNYLQFQLLVAQNKDKNSRVFFFWFLVLVNGKPQRQSLFDWWNTIEFLSIVSVDDGFWKHSKLFDWIITTCLAFIHLFFFSLLHFLQHFMCQNLHIFSFIVDTQVFYAGTELNFCNNYKRKISKWVKLWSPLKTIWVVKILWYFRLIFVFQFFFPWTKKIKGSTQENNFGIIVKRSKK